MKKNTYKGSHFDVTDSLGVIKTECFLMISLPIWSCSYLAQQWHSVISAQNFNYRYSRSN